MKYDEIYYYKAVENGIIQMIGSGSKETTLFDPITEEKYEELKAKMQEKPDDTLELVYRLEDDSEEYKGYERTHEEFIEWYTNAVVSGDIALTDVPEEYRAEIILPEPELNEENLNKAYREGVQNA